MAFHVPFSQRPSGRNHRQPPVYIGFDRPRRKRQKLNGWALGGFLVFIFSFGILSPIALLMSLLGLRRKPRRLAAVGTTFSLIGTLVMAGAIFATVHRAEQVREHRHAVAQSRVIQKQVLKGNQLLSSAASEFEEFRDDHDGKLPQDIDGNSLAIKHIDPWGELLRYEVERDYALLRSAGPDSQFYSDDDLTYKMEGETERSALLPIE